MPPASQGLYSQGIPIIGPILNRIIGTRNDRFVKKYTSRVEVINSLDAQTRTLTDAQLKLKIEEFRARIDKGETAGDLIPDAFAVAREAMDRAVGLRNVFNPKHEALFDASKLPPSAREMYEAIKAQVAALPPAPPTGEFLGCSEPVHGYMQVDIPVELYEAIRQVYTVSKPPFRARPFDVQLIGGMVLYQGKIAEMKTGEGKTIVGPLACYLAAIERMKVHVVTVNDYLVQRDRDWTFPYFHALGLTVGAIHPMHMQPEHMKRDMYKCDVVYGTTAEFGFDYLRDNMKRSVEQQVQKVRHFAIVDEVDSILIDEARTPLIISGSAHEDAPRYDLADKLARHLVQKNRPYLEADEKVQHCKRLAKGLEGDIRNARDKAQLPELQARLKAAQAELPELEKARSKYTQFFEVELERKQAHVTHDGIAEAQRVAGLGSFYVGENMDLPHLLNQAVRAHSVYQLDRDYIIMPTENPQTGRQEPGIVIVDTNTGRPMIGRQWSDGLHQAVEAKEGVPIRQETQTVATVTIQNFFKMYKRLAGMTGTADTEAQEFHDIYKLDVVSIPTNRAVSRSDRDDLMFLVGKDKWNSIVDEIKVFNDVGRPVLVGTTSVERSEFLSKMLTQKHGVKHEVLNAKQHEREAHIVENAGQLGAVMIATNMAGRGTDIKLGTITREQLLDHWLRRGICSRELTTQATTDQLRENVYRKVGSRELDIPKHEIEQMPYPELESRLLKHWALKYTWMSPKAIESASADQLRAELDAQGRFLLHKIDWFDSIEQLGGLHVIGTERHESRRIDNQLRGRSGRQGDKGSSRFYVALDDDLMKMFAGERTMKLLSFIGMKEGDAIEHPRLSKSVEQAQRKVEERNFQHRKNILEYDEVMEHQRQAFYGLRQRVLEGRDLRGLIFGYIRDAVTDTTSEYLAKDYAATCAAEYVRQTVDISVEPDRLRGMDLEDLDKRVREDAKQEARQLIDVTLGEYIPSEGSEFEMDFDAEGLVRWARGHFGVDLNVEEIKSQGTQGRKRVRETLAAAAERRIDEANLDGLARFVEKDYGARELAHWAKNKFGIIVDPAKISEAALVSNEQVHALIVKEAEGLYRTHEAKYPVEFAMNGAMSLARQNPPAAMEYLSKFANDRFQLGWSPDTVRTTPPPKAKELLLDASKKFVDAGVVETRVREALAISDLDQLSTWFKDTLKADAPENLKRQDARERDNAIRSKVEATLRPELLFFERTMLLEVLDDLWKNHLYAMDQLRDSISFRSFSQQDPRIEYKREGSGMFKQMMVNVRDRVTDMIFKVQLMPQYNAPQTPQPQQPRPPMQPQSPAAGAPRPGGMLGGGGGSGGGSGGIGGSMIAGPGMGMLSGPGLDQPVRPPAAAPSERAQRDIDAANRAGTDPSAKPAPVVKSEKRYGRNDDCPMGCGRKYKRCCNRPDGQCNGQGMHSAPPAEDNADD